MPKSILFFLSIILSTLHCVPLLAASPESRTGPTNPGLSAYIQSRTAKRLAPTPAQNLRPLGHVPSPMPPRVHVPVETLRRQAVPEQILPTKFDLRDPDGDGTPTDSPLPPIRSQGDCGACWAFSTYGVLESTLKNRYGLTGEENDFSESHLAQNHRFEFLPCEGGNIDMATAMFARHDGPVLERDVPYSAVYEDWPPELSLVPARYIDNVLHLPVRSSVSDNIYLKEAILDHGPLYCSMYYTDDAFDSAANTHIFQGYAYYPNHDVVIVGWDDAKEVAGALGPGAFIVRNNWGSEWGEDGYFYVSYEDTMFGFDSIARIVDEPEFRIDSVYGYDPLGMTGSFGFEGQDSTWGANLFKAERDGKIVGVSFYTTGATNYEITIYDDFSGEGFSTVLWQGNGTVSESGYFTVPVTDRVPVTTNDQFAVSIRFQGLEDVLPLPVERTIYGYAEATAEPGTSFISSDGVNFYDFTTELPTGNVCIKALVSTDLNPVIGDIAPLDAPNGIVDIGDAVLALRHVVGEVDLSTEQKNLIDVAPLKRQDGGVHVSLGDGQVGINDAVAIVRKAVGGLSWVTETAP